MRLVENIFHKHTDHTPAMPKLNWRNRSSRRNRGSRHTPSDQIHLIQQVRHLATNLLQISGNMEAIITGTRDFSLSLNRLAMKLAKGQQLNHIESCEILQTEAWIRHPLLQQFLNFTQPANQRPVDACDGLSGCSGSEASTLDGQDFYHRDSFNVDNKDFLTADSTMDDLDWDTGGIELSCSTGYGGSSLLSSGTNSKDVSPYSPLTEYNLTLAPVITESMMVSQTPHNIDSRQYKPVYEEFLEMSLEMENGFEFDETIDFAPSLPLQLSTNSESSTHSSMPAVCGSITSLTYDKHINPWNAYACLADDLTNNSLVDISYCEKKTPKKSTNQDHAYENNNGETKLNQTIDASQVWSSLQRFTFLPSVLRFPNHSSHRRAIFV